MKVEWVPIGNVLELQRRDVQIRPEHTYQEIGVRSFGKGLFIKPPVQGAELGDKRVFEIRAGDFVVSNVFGWEGAVGVAAMEHDRLIGSHRFMTWTPRGDANVEYLRHYFGSEAGVAKLAAASPGSAGRNRTLSIKNFEQVLVPLPSRGEQDRISTHLASLSRAGRLHRSDDLLPITHCDFSGSRLRIGDVAVPAPRRVQSVATSTYAMQGVKWYGEGLFTRETRLGADLPNWIYRIEPGDLVYNRLFAWKQSFALADSPGWASNEFPTFRIDTQLVRPRVLLAALLGPSFTAAVNSASTGTTPTSRNRLKERDFLSLPITLPLPEDQACIESSLRLADRIKDQRRTASSIAAALLPAARNEIFNSMGLELHPDGMP